MTDIAMTDDASMIADSAAEFAKGSGGVARARAVRDKAIALDRDVWQQIADLGWLGMITPETSEGLGLGVRDMCALVESVGRTLLPEPLVSSMATAGLLAECGNEEAAGALQRLMAGKQVWATAAVAAASATGLQLANVPDCHAGMGLLVARTERNTFELRAIEVDAAGVEKRTAACVDGSTLSDAAIAAAAWNRAPVFAAGPQAQAAWQRTQDTMLLGYSAFLVGVMDEALKIAIDYMKMRKQFGTPIGTFQALQHRAATCHVDVVASRALVYEACRAFSTGLRARAACAAKARASAAALRVCKECVQFHGAIGFADEHDIGLYLRKALTISARLGGELQQKLRLDNL
jgi:alkylation response protein AidB-like acyl-CoA dehydrogenase